KSRVYEILSLPSRHKVHLPDRVSTSSPMSPRRAPDSPAPCGLHYPKSCAIVRSVRRGSSRSSWSTRQVASRLFARSLQKCLRSRKAQLQLQWVLDEPSPAQHPTRLAPALWNPNSPQYTSKFRLH